MSGPDPKQLSSNWKRLQQKLEADKKKDTSEKNGLKRKREATKPTTTSIKKTKLTKPAPKPRTKMGSYLSTPSTSNHKTLITDHDIDPTSLTAAYGPSSIPQPTHTDTLNTGHHPSNKLGKFIALDCEMVGTGPPPHDDSLLARVSLVNYHGAQIYDSFVLPPPNLPVKDYRTHVSGIKPQHLRPGYARPFAEVQADVAKILDGRVLVGHALRNDLNVLMLAHPRRDMRDTSRYAKFRIESGGRPPALRKLARSELGLEIQTGEHSSLEDARTAMALYRKEKAGFEEESRRLYGERRVVRKGKEKEKSPDGEDEDSGEEDEEEDLELLDGEEDEGVEEGTSKSGQVKAKKKKKKKRTKRK
ncbi:hypothetical protein PRZ48_014222 [Zasmidium cellare]|uniref:RNA exonuclease 4 n=1 Tax=Zasmidium cellare TaxID=395010 RepID=A0ABR0E0B9_ZASCE|nr:hypothetical protein PRZ48_014222 [Zasmidium cellare]